MMYVDERVVSVVELCGVVWCAFISYSLRLCVCIEVTVCVFEMGHKPDVCSRMSHSSVFAF